MKEFIKKSFDKINNWIGSLRKDLIIHAGVSILIFVIIFNLLSICMIPSFAALWATFITLAIGTIKEYFVDKLLRDSYADIQDLYADAVGTMLGVIAIIPALF